nr:MAG TPA: hypothetical protein [Caudoviricetes sp.]
MRLPCLLAVQWLLIRQVNRLECTDLTINDYEICIMKVLKDIKKTTFRSAMSIFL